MTHRIAAVENNFMSHHHSNISSVPPLQQCSPTSPSSTAYSITPISTPSPTNSFTRKTLTPKSALSTGSRKSTNYFSNIANVVCLFWFNDYALLETSYDHKAPTYPALFSPLTKPTNSFKQFIMNVIKHTQLPPTAISLALYYILQLKKCSPKPIIGNANSEYRVFSVALMLANKFLDDNTYTNQTWADVTHLPLKEISTMEVEFLSNLQYRLFVSGPDWAHWQSRISVWLGVHSGVCKHQDALVLQYSPTTKKRPIADILEPEDYQLNCIKPISTNILNNHNLHLHPVKRQYQHYNQQFTPTTTPITSATHMPSQISVISPIFNTYPTHSYPLKPASLLTANANNMSYSNAPSPAIPPTVYYYTLVDQKYKLNPSPHYGVLPPYQQQQQLQQFTQPYLGIYP